MVPCSGAISEPTVQQEDSEVRVASLDPAQRTVSTINIVAPMPMMRPGSEATTTAVASVDPNAVIPFSRPA
jgi:hypothetical protein